MEKPTINVDGIGVPQQSNIIPRTLSKEEEELLTLLAKMFADGIMSGKIRSNKK
jgi:hypothetical protein